MATVYLAHDLKHDRDVAHQGAAPRTRAPRSAPNGSSARSAPPRACSIRTFCRCSTRGEADGLLYYVMPFVAGETLRARSGAREPAADRRRRAHRARSGRRARLRASRRASSIATSSRRTSCCTTGRALVADFGIALAVQGRRSRMTQTGTEPRHAAVHEPRAGDGRAHHRRAQRCLRAGLRAVRDARRRAAVHRPDGAGDRGEGDDSRAGASVHAIARRCRRTWKTRCPWRSPSCRPIGLPPPRNLRRRSAMRPSPPRVAHDTLRPGRSRAGGPRSSLPDW